MLAIRHHEFGPADILVLDQLEDLTPSRGEVRIEVAACGVHLLDTTLRRGEPGPMPAPELPTIPGREVAGVVDRVGEGVDAGWVGRRVVAHLGMVPGGYAEQAVTDVSKLFVVPDEVGLPEAVAAVGTGRTALGILELEPPRAGDRVLVLSAAGGLGWLLVQGTHERGATVVAAARGPERTRRLAALTPELVVDYGDEGWTGRVQATGGVDLVYDGVGGQLGRSALELLRPGGRLVMFGFSSGAPTRFDTSDVVSRGLSVDGASDRRCWRCPEGSRGWPGGHWNGSRPGHGGRSSRRTRSVTRPERTPTSSSAGRWAKSSSWWTDENE